MDYKEVADIRFDRKVLLVSTLSAVAYIILFRVIYTDYLYPLFGYIGIPCVAYLLIRGAGAVRQRKKAI